MLMTITKAYQGLQNNHGANQSLLQEKVQEWMSSLGSKLEEKSPQAEEKVLIHLSSSLTLLSRYHLCHVHDVSLRRKANVIAITAGECCEHRHPSATIHWRNSKHQRQRTPPELCWCNQWFAITGQSWQELQKQGGEGGGGGPGEENEEEGGGGEKEREGTVSIWQGHPSPSHGMSQKVTDKNMTIIVNHRSGANGQTASNPGKNRSHRREKRQEEVVRWKQVKWLYIDYHGQSWQSWWQPSQAKESVNESALARDGAEAAHQLPSICKQAADREIRRK